MSFLTTFKNDAERVVTSVDSFFSRLAGNKNWQTEFTISIQALAGTVEGVAETTGKEAQAAEIQKGVAIINSDFATLVGLVNGYAPSAHGTFVAQVTAAISLIQSNLSQILTLVDVKNTTTVNEVTGTTTVVAAGLEALLALIPAPAPAPAA